MKSSAPMTTSQRTRLAAFVLALTTILGTPVSAKSVDPRNDNASARVLNHSAAAHPAARPAAPARTNMARPSARPNTAAHMSRPDARRPRRAREDHRAVAHCSEHTARPGSGATHGGRPDFRSASFNRGHAENLHGGREIPQDRFRASFGGEHQFHIGHPIMIGGQASFQFGGFWFGMVDPWPAAWLYTDPVYVDVVDGGYVLVNVAHPDVQATLSAGDPALATCAAAAPAPAPVVVVRPVVPVTVAYTAPAYSYFTWHYWRPYWHHYWR